MIPRSLGNAKKYKSLPVIIPATAWITSKCRLGRRPDSFSCFQKMEGFWAVVVNAVDSQVCGVQQRKYRRESPRSRDEKRTPRWESPNAQFRIGRREAEIKRDIPRHRSRDLNSFNRRQAGTITSQPCESASCVTFNTEFDPLKFCQSVQELLFLMEKLGKNNTKEREKNISRIIVSGQVDIS